MQIGCCRLENKYQSNCYMYLLKLWPGPAEVKVDRDNIHRLGIRHTPPALTCCQVPVVLGVFCTASSAQGLSSKVPAPCRMLGVSGRVHQCPYKPAHGAGRKAAYVGEGRAYGQRWLVVIACSRVLSSESTNAHTGSCMRRRNTQAVTEGRHVRGFVSMMGASAPSQNAPLCGFGMRSGAVWFVCVCTAQGQSQHGEGRWATS